MKSEEYFTAEDARVVSNEVCAKQQKEKLDWIYKLITKACYHGKHFVTFSNTSIEEATRKFLEDKGFKVSHFSGDQLEPAEYTTISW